MVLTIDFCSPAVGGDKGCGFIFNEDEFCSTLGFLSSLVFLRSRHIRGCVFDVVPEGPGAVVTFAFAVGSALLFALELLVLVLRSSRGYACCPIPEDAVFVPG